MQICFNLLETAALPVFTKNVHFYHCLQFNFLYTFCYHCLGQSIKELMNSRIKIRFITKFYTWMHTSKFKTKRKTIWKVWDLETIILHSQKLQRYFEPLTNSIIFKLYCNYFCMTLCKVAKFQISRTSWPVFEQTKSSWLDDHSDSRLKLMMCAN